MDLALIPYANKNSHRLARYASQKGYLPVFMPVYWNASSNKKSRPILEKVDLVLFVPEWEQPKIVEEARSMGIKIETVRKEELNFCPTCDGTKEVANFECPTCGNYDIAIE